MKIKKPWQPIETAPKDGKQLVDLLAKGWDAKSDKFVLRRFTDMIWWEDKETFLKPPFGEWRYESGMAKPGKNWRIIAWMRVPVEELSL